ncbi:hypothetical protein [Verrucosispora sp. WMMD1129]|uniref:hypothetical protein n=1 Tax=Verrucosispora sp. WMMD1129 TaxID=3016093 RepID=UPI002499AD29|nr:hypothetical protein [Verrucosispora sp. WMMD1129]WFE47611.1 hypothetical protein O7624_26460 [Verrucosispora sp. WMMD1129]
MEISKRREEDVTATTGEAQAPDLAEKDQVRWDAPWGPADRSGTVMYVRDGRVWVQESGEDAVWVMRVEEVTRVEPANVDDHIDCRGFDNQEFYWHCYTHEVYRQSF